MTRTQKRTPKRMKRMRPSQRKVYVDMLIEKWYRTLTCTVGEWNRDKIMIDVERALREKRKGKSD